MPYHPLVGHPRVHGNGRGAMGIQWYLALQKSRLLIRNAVYPSHIIAKKPRFDAHFREIKAYVAVIA